MLQSGSRKRLSAQQSLDNLCGVRAIPNTDIADILDLYRYPLDQPNAPEVQSLLTDGKQALRDRALFQLPGFVRPAATQAMAAELVAKNMTAAIIRF